MRCTPIPIELSIYNVLQTFIHPDTLILSPKHPLTEIPRNVEFQGGNRGGKMLEDPRLDRNKIRVPRRDSYEKRPVLSATIHPDIKRTLVAMSERTGMTVSQVADEVLYTGLLEMQELPDLSE